MKLLNTFVFKIIGIHHEENAREIAFALDEHGFNYAVIDQDSQELIIPHNYLNLIDRIKLVIESVGSFTLIV